MSSSPWKNLNSLFTDPSAERTVFIECSIPYDYNLYRFQGAYLFSSPREGKNWRHGLGCLHVIFGIQNKNILFGGIKLLTKITRIHSCQHFTRKNGLPYVKHTWNGIRVCYFYGLLTRREVKITGYLPNSVCVSICAGVHKHAKRERDKYPAILTSHLVNKGFIMLAVTNR